MMRATPFAPALLAALALGPAAVASDPCGIYARVTRVELDPANPPQWAKVSGDFILVKTSGRLCGPERGYMYFGVNPANPELCRLEWADLAKLAGREGQNYVAFGSAHSRVQVSLGPNQNGPNVRKEGEPPGDPIPYPVNHGLTRLRT